MVTKEDSEKYKDIISNFVKFHIQLNQLPEIKRDIINFTIREISLFMQALTDENNKLSPYELILIIYGSKYPKEKLSIIENLLKNCNINSIPDNEINNIAEQGINKKNLQKKKDSDSENNLDEKKEIGQIENNFQNCFVNQSLKRACKAISFAINYGKNVIILGKQGSGKTQLAIWIAEYFDKKNKVLLDKNNNEDIYLCICNEILTCSDLIGRQRPTKDLQNSIGQLIKWKNGFVVKGMLKGKCVILDRLEKVRPTVTERLNCLLDVNYLHNKEYFEIPENPEFSNGLEINQNFRIIATVEEDELNKMSPAFINRFIIIYLDDQLENLQEEDIYSLSKMSIL